MANLPANPGQALWIGSDGGKYHCNVGIGGPGGDLDHTDYSQAQIESGFSLPDYFFLDANGDVVFKQYVENGRTSTNTKYARTELRELQPNGTTKAAWDSSSGTFSDEAISKIDHVPSAKPWVVFFQVHDADSDFFRVQTEDGAIVCRRTPPGGSEIRTVLRSSYTIGAWISWKWQFDSGRLRIWLDGTVVLDVTGMSKTGCYAKFGCYNQVNNRSDGGNAPTGEYCQVTVQRGSVKRVRPGYPASSTPVFTGGTDPGGGPGGGAGSDTQAPTTPTNLTVTATDAGNQLSWGASTDNVGVDHYNIYRSSGTSTGGTGGTPDLSTAAGRLGWGTPLPSSDEFNYTGAPDPAKWNVYSGAGHDGNGVRSPNRVTVTNGKMVLTGLDGSANTAGMEHRLNQQYGRWEVRVKSYYTNDPTAPGDKSGGYHPVLIVWSDDASWPAAGEYDFCENGEPGEQQADGFMHYPSLNGTDHQEELPRIAVDLREWHNFAFEWTSDGLTGWIDGVQWFTLSGGAVAGQRAAIQAMPSGHLTVQLDALQATSCIASTMEVDWVRVYSLTGGGGTDVGGGATSSTFGRQTVGSATTTSSADKLIASKFTAADAGTLTAGHARMWLDATGSTHARQLIYADSGGSPGALLATSDEATLTSTTSGNVVDFTFSGAAQISIAAGTSYWIAVSWDDPGTPNLVYSRDTQSSLRRERSDITYGTFPNPFGTATGTFAGPIDTWAVTGTAGGGGGTITTTSSFGKQTDGASSSASTADKTAVSKFTATDTGTLSAGHVRAWMSAGSATCKAVVYADSGGNPGALLAQSDAKTISNTAEQVIDFAFSGSNRIAITSGTAYWLGLSWQDPGAASLNLSRDGTTGGRQESSSYVPNPFGTPTTLTGPIDVYVGVQSTTTTGGGGGGQVGQTLIAQTAGTSYLDTTTATSGGGTNSGQSLGVGGIPTPAPGPNVVLADADSSSRLNISTSGTSTTPRIYDGRGHSTAGVTVTASNVIVQNFVIHNSGHDAVSIFGDNVTLQNCDIYDVYDDGTGDINAITLFGDGIRILFNTCGVTGLLARSPVGGSHTDFVQTWNTSSKQSTSNLIVQGNRVVGPGTSDSRFIHQGVQGEGKNSTDGGGGGSGVSSGWLIADNSFEMSCVNQVLNFLDIHDVKITRNTFAGSSAHVVGTGDGSDGIVFYDDNDTSAFSGTVPSTTPGPGPAGVVTGGGSTGGGAEAPAYTYAVSAVDAAGNESGQAIVGGGSGVPDAGAPTVPTNLAAVPGDGRVSLTWDPSTDDVGVDHYIVRRGGSITGFPTATSYVDVVPNDATYSYTVSAVDAAGNESAQTAAVSATPTAAPIGGVALLPGRLSGGRVEVSIAWGADLTADEATWNWSDITADVRHDPGISCVLGRNDESETSNPANLTLVLDNTQSDYSLGTVSPHYPNVRRNTPVRVRVDPGDGAGGRTVFLGFADGFTPGWDTMSGRVPVVTLSASGTLRRLGQGKAPIQSAYRRVMTASSTVVAYWPFEEGNSSRLAPCVKGGADMTLVGRPDWASIDEFDCSASLPSLRDGHFTAAVNSYTDTGQGQLRFLLSVPDNGLDDDTTLVRITTTGTLNQWDIVYRIFADASAGLQLRKYSGSTLFSEDAIALDPRGKPARVGLDWTQAGSNLAWNLSLTPPGVTALFGGLTISGKTFGVVTQVEVNPLGAKVDAGFGHLTIENAVTNLFSDFDALIAYAGEFVTGDVEGRLVRLCDENQTAIQLYGVAGTRGTIDKMGPQLVAPLLDLLHECETADQGQLWDGRNAGLSYTTRKRRQLGTVKLTVDAGAGQLAGEFTPVDDDQRNRNKVTVTRLHGVTVTYEDTAGPLGTATIGIYDDSITVNTADDTSAIRFARWFVALGTVEGYRYPSVTVDLAASPELAPAVLDIIPGERVQVINLDTTLAGFPDSTVDLIVEGIAHEVTTRSWKATFRCSPYSPWAVGLEGV